MSTFGTAAMLWVPLTLVAAMAQVVRNGAQANLTARIGTLGATQVRFVFGLPFAVLFLAHGERGVSTSPYQDSSLYPVK